MRKLIFIFSVISLVSCSSIRISQQFYKDDIYIIQQLERADIYYPQEKVIMIANQNYKFMDTLERSVLMQLAKNKKNIYIKPIDKNISCKDVRLAILMSPISYSLLLSGDAIVFDKKNKEFIKKIRYKVNRSNGTINSIAFLFQDGTVFYRNMIAITEIDK